MTRAGLPALLLLAAACSSASPEEGRLDTDSGAAEDAAHDDGTSADTAAPRADGASDADASADTGVDSSTDAHPPDADTDAGDGCFVSTDGVSGECMTVMACTALGSHSSVPGYCPGPSSFECCTLTPNVADNPPVPAGWELMAQADVTPAMTSWAVAILDAPTTYPMFSTTMMAFGTLTVMARVEWHPPDFQNDTVHRGVTLYQPV